MVKKGDLLTFETFAKFPTVVHGFSTCSFGNLHPLQKDFLSSLKPFAEALHIDHRKVVTMDQAHGNKVVWVSQQDGGKTIAQVDGLLTKEQNIFLSVATADCIPLLLYDPVNQYVGVVHAGWRGLFKEIIKEAITELIAKGSKSENILVGIGPSIGSCCYDIAKDHRDKLLKTFPDWEPFITHREGKYFLDISGVAQYQLKTLGILSRNIEDAHYCTFDHDDVYSYRREKEQAGRMLGIIGIM